MKRFVAPILVLLGASSLFGQQEPERVALRTRIVKQSATTTGDRGLFTVPGVETLTRNQYSLGYALSNLDRTPQDIDINVLPVYFSYGVTPHLTITGTFETQRQVTARNPLQPGFNSSLPFIRQEFARGYGDTIISAKYRLQRMGNNVGGIAMKGFVKIGTADPEKGLGTGSPDAGLDLIFSSLLPLDFLLHSNLAYTATSDAKEPFEIGIKDEMRSGLGVAWPATGLVLGTGALQGVFEYATVTYVGAGSENFATTSIQNAADIAAGIRYLMLDQGLTIDAGYRVNRAFDLDFPGNRNRHGFAFNLSYTRPVAVPNLSNRSPVIALESDSGEIAPGGSMVITASGFDADNDPLTYSWSATGGQISGSGERVTFNAAGLAPGKYTVRAEAADGKGGLAISAIDITVRR